MAFPDVADVVTVRRAEAFTLHLTGSGAAALSAGSVDDNLVLRAARFFMQAHGLSRGVAVHLEKNLPVASGIGGGSADAAAVLRALARLTGRPVPAGAESLGADVPMCVVERPARVTGIGEIVEPLASPLPPLGIVLVNPGVPVATPAVFRALASRENPPLPPLPARWTAPDLVAWLAATRNDLEAPAIAVQPAIADVLASLRADPAVRLARMSGSGATCFALTDDVSSARDLARRLVPRWGASGWIADAALT